MFVGHRRIVVAGVAAAAAIAIPAAALASGGASPSRSGPTAAASKSPGANQQVDRGAAAAQKSAAAESAGGAVSFTGAPEVAALVHQLGVSPTAARHALARVQALSGDGVEPTDPAFVAIARSLHVSADRLAFALRAVKQAVAGR